MTALRCRVILLDGAVIERDLEKKAVGQVLFNEVCEYLNLLERDYFGLAAWDSSNNKVWLEFSKPVHKQIISHDTTFTFSVKLYPPDPSLLAEDITRYLLCLQLRADILASRLPCPSDILAVLGSYTVQAEFGDYNPELHRKEFFSNIPLAPNQTPELEEDVAELHQTLKSMSPAEADQGFLQNVKTLHMYGVHLHPAKDASGGDVMLGVCAEGLVVYEDEENTQSFSWPTVLNISYKRSNFQARIFHSEDASENTIKFTLPSYRACKCLWKIAVEHHGFFRNLKDLAKAPLQLGSRNEESLEVSTTIKRAAPRFARSTIKRKAKESFRVDMKRPNRTEFVDWFQLLSSDETWPAYSPDKYQVTAGETLAYKEREEVDELDNEWFQLLGGRSFPTQHPYSSLSSDSDILESDKFQVWKLQADDWFVLLEPHTYQPGVRHWKTQLLSFQSSQAEEQTEELEYIKGNSEKSINIVWKRNEDDAVTEQHEELEMERNLSPDVVGKNLELETRGSEQIVKVMREMMEGEVDGEELQTVVMYEQRRQVVESYAGQPQEAFVEQRIRTEHELMLKPGEVVSEENIEELEETLQEVESVERTLQDIERLKGKLQEVELLEQKLQEVQQAGRQLGENDDWYILLENKLMASSAPVRLLGVETSEKKLQKKPEQGDRGDWYLMLDRKPLVVSSANAGLATDTTERKAELSQWTEEKLQRANILTSVQMKDDWYNLLDLLPRPTQTTQPALPPSVETVQSSWVNVVEEHKNLDEESKWREERTIYVEETHPILPVQREEQTQKQVDDDRFIQLYVPPKEAGKQTAVDVHKETREEEVQLIKPQVKTIIIEEERREMLETAHEVVHMNPIPFEKRDVPAGLTMDTTERKAEMSQWTEEKLQGANTLTSVQMKDDWYTLLDLLPQPTQTTQPALPQSVETVQSSWVNVVEEHKNLDEESKWREERTIYVGETQPILPVQREEQTQKQVDDDWFVQLYVPPKEAAVDVHKETREEEVQLIKPQVKTIIIEEERREMLETAHEVVHMNPIPFEKRDVPAGLTMDTTERKAEMSQWTEEKLQGANTLTSVQMKDDWYILLDLLPRPTQTTKPALLNTTEQKAEITQWIEGELQRANTLPPVQMKDDWDNFLDLPTRPTQTTQTELPPSGTTKTTPAVDVHKETREEEVQLIKKQVKMMKSEEERREMQETSHEVIQMKPIPFEKRDVSSGATFYTTEQRAEIRPWIGEELQRANTLPPVQMKDDWYILLDFLPRPTQTTQPALTPSGTTITTPDVASLIPRQTVTIKEKEVTFVKKPMIINEKQVIVGRVEKKIPATMHKDEDNWFVLFTPEQIEKKVIATAGVSDTWVLEEKRLREVQKGQLRKDVKRSHVVEDKRLHPYVPGPKAEKRHQEVIDDWFLLLEPVSKISVNIYKRAEEDQRRKDELFKKQALAEDRRKVAGFIHPSVPVIPLTPADQPMTSTPTAQSVRITRPTYQEESLKRLEITQEITQDIKQESKVESESIIKRKKREKRIEGESIYIRHSILMLEDSDVTQEIVLNHHASVSELKRIFMEDMPVFGPTEWDRRLSTYTPVIYPKLSIGELFNGIDIMGAEGLSAM
ncbi:protein 4.1b isoform X5 [Tachysurus fulvidraco]|uniref:protein 4.1b isoform X5 n=1 Tax=Tachysurus fulvidraco TaxID=1234273 RepID=UPI001FEFFEFB|nr:protein 4.1b isoform X5 [Tachysurus fulvidraco]